MNALAAVTAATMLTLVFAPSRAQAQQSPAYEEAVFGLTVKDLGSFNIAVADRHGRLYLPVMEFFTIGGVYYTVEGQNRLKGNYLASDVPMLIDPPEHVITVGNHTYKLSEEEMFKGDIDIYLSTEKWEEIFGITCAVNMNMLQIVATTEKQLPALVRRRNEAKRQEAGGYSFVRGLYPLRYDRARSLFAAGVLDYNVATFFDRLSLQSTSYTLTGGGEVGGGDVQGTMTGVTGKGVSSTAFTNVRWQYVVRENEYLSAISAGQLLTGSEYVPNVTGLGITNEPVEPRVLLDNYFVDGYTEAESDVELYVNDRLVDFQKANAAGYYRFSFPLTYGTMKVGIKTFSQYGDINVSEKQLQIPFTFLPQGTLTYNVQGGKVENNPLLGNEAYFASANLLYGAANWLTLKGGAERKIHTVSADPFYHVGASTRLFSQFIVNVDVAPEAYTRVDANALLASDIGIYAQYANSFAVDTLIGLTPQKTAALGLSVPLGFISAGTGFRISENYSDAASGKRLDTRLDLTTRVADVALLLNYRETNGGTPAPGISGDGRIAATATYSVPRSDALPGVLQRLLLRAGMTYDLPSREIVSAQCQLSKTFLQIFQFNLGVARDFASNAVSVQAGLIMDLNLTRTSSVYDHTSTGNTMRHALYGSVGLDNTSATPYLTNREQVGKGGIAVALFIDNNDNGVYDAGDELIPANGVRLDGMGKIELGADSLLRVTQLQNYYRYNLEINRDQIDPTLVPVDDKFSFVTDPNHFKRIEIPFYRGGTVEGTVYLEHDSIRTPLGGTRVIMRSLDGGRGDTLRTFADGGFYAMNVAPGRYALSVDSNQVEFLRAVQNIGPLGITVHRSPQGDLVDQLELVLERNRDETAQAAPQGKAGAPPSAGGVTEGVSMPGGGAGAVPHPHFSVRIGSFINRDFAEEAAALARDRFHIPVTDDYSRDDDLYLVHAGQFRTHQEAEDFLLRLRQEFPLEYGDAGIFRHVH